MNQFQRLRILTLVLLGMMALGLLTWGIGKAYLELVDHSAKVRIPQITSDGQAKNQADTLVLPKATFWTCQIGVFQSEENAQSCLKQLQELANDGGIISRDPWIVAIGLGHTAKELSGVKEALAAKGIPAVIKQVELQERSFRVMGNGSRLTIELLANVNALLQEGISSQRLAQEQQIWNSLAGEHSPSQLVQLHNLYNLLRAKNDPQDQQLLGLSLYFAATRIINAFSGK
ncbi:sporulation protein [Desulfosporosinus sp. FKA]|uniref:SPOR domain-containing protein n=1 Tax=Desulfosporosinus sp. FKA TaxID=1969834 RepID=UPI000B497DE0|nr:sporulation protein [Desulfosporosinus sp. FKA]